MCPFFLSVLFMENEDNHPIPDELLSFKEKAMFTHCIECEKELVKSNADYMIEKAFRQYTGYKAKDVIFEYAICVDCAFKMKQQISKASLKTIQDYFMQFPQFVSDRNTPLAAGEQECKRLLETCALTGKQADDLEEYQIFAFCKGAKLQPAMKPYMISGAIADALSEKLSDETQGFFDDFGGKHFGIPPEFEKVSGRKLIFL